MPRFIRRHLEEPVPIAAIDRALDLRAAGSQLTPLPDATPLPSLTPLQDDLSPSEPLSGLPVATAAVRSTLPEVEDGRTFHPDVITRPSKTVRGSRSSLKAAPPRGAANLGQTMNGVQFQKSASVIICIRRHARRAVILATGRGGSRHRDPVWSETSNIWCTDVGYARRL